MGDQICQYLGKYMAYSQMVDTTEGPYDALQYDDHRLTLTSFPRSQQKIMWKCLCFWIWARFDVWGCAIFWVLFSDRLTCLSAGIGLRSL